MSVTATVVVRFEGASANGQLQAEVDSRPDGYNGGRTTFTPGDEPVILVRKSDNVTISAVKTSLGVCTLIGEGTTDEQEYVTFMDSKSANLNKPVRSNLQTQWVGADLGATKLVNQNELVLQGPPSGAGVLDVQYKSQFYAYRLSGIPSEVNGKKNFQVMVGFVGVVT